MSNQSLALLASLAIMLSTFPASAQLIVAHRGASHDAPENTIAAFHLAWQQGADAIEGDFHLTRDGHIVCHHDRTTERITGTNLQIASAKLAELRKLDIGAWKHEKFRGERIATLPEVLGTVPERKIIYVEVKCGPEIVPKLQQDLRESNLKSAEVRIIAFDQQVIRAVKRAMPAYSAYWLVSPKQENDNGPWFPSRQQIIQTALDAKADGIGINGNVQVADHSFFVACHRANLSTHVWTIDDPAQATHFARLGAASITTNRPKFIRQALAIYEQRPK